MAFEVKIHDCQITELNPKIREYFVKSRNNSTPVALAYSNSGPNQCVVSFATRSEALFAQQDLLEQFNCSATEVVLPSYRYHICTTKKAYKYESFIRSQAEGLSHVIAAYLFGPREHNHDECEQCTVHPTTEKDVFASLSIVVEIVIRAPYDTGMDVSPALGIEVTVPALAAQCELGNIDPQHLGCTCHDPRLSALDDAYVSPVTPRVAAISVAREWPIPPTGTALVTIRPDPDSLGAMAVLTMSLQEEPRRNASDVIERINLVAKADTFAQGEWRAQPLPDHDDPWPFDGGVEDTRKLAAIQSICADSRLSLAQRVEYMRQWLLQGEPGGDWYDNFPEDREWISAMLIARARVEEERKKMISAIENAEIKIMWNRSLRGLGDKIPLQVCIVESTHRAATMLGYCMAPIVIAVNPRFTFNGGPEHLKYTICQWHEGYVYLDTVATQLNALERFERGGEVENRPRWGGGKTIKGSEQGVSSLLSIEQVMHVVRDNLIEKGGK